MQENDEIEYRATLTFHSFKAYLVDDVTGQITEHMHLCDNTDKKIISGCYDNSRQINFRNWRDIEALTTKNSVCAQCYDEKTRWDDYLAKRIYQAVVSEKFSLWNDKLNMVVDVPIHSVEKEPTLEQIKFWIKHAYIFKTDLIKFCKGERIRVIFNGEQTVNNNLRPEQRSSLILKEYITGLVSKQSAQKLRVNSEDTLPGHIESAKPSEKTEDRSVKLTSLATNLDCTSSIIIMNNKASDAPPGKLPRVAIGQLAIKAAWEIECETGRYATADEVIARLQAWADKGEDGYLHSKINFGVKWITKRGNIVKVYTIEACGKALQTWIRSRR